MYTVRTVVLTILITLSCLLARAEMLPNDAISASVIYHFPTAYQQNEKADAAAQAKWEQFQRSFEVAFTNKLFAEVTVTGRELTITETNGVKVSPSLLVTRELPDLPTAKVPASSTKTLTIDPKDYAYELTPGKTYLVRLVWKVSANGAEGEYTQIFPYLTPDPMPTFASEWVASNGISARLFIRHTEKKGLSIFAELRNDTSKPSNMSLSPIANNEVTVNGNQGKVISEAVKDVDAPTIPLLFPDGGTTTVLVGSGTNNYLALMPKSYQLAPGEYQLSVTLHAVGTRDIQYEWKLPPFVFIMPQNEQVPIYQPLRWLLLD
ncbi:MAG: hypothetical protein ACYDBB_23885 [Armatimonadota bacterium]